MKKLIFIDVDGTLLKEDHNILESTIEACKQARQNGHVLFLSTGRSKAELYQFILDIGFDGLICANGGYVEIQGKPLYHKIVSEQDVKDIVDFFDQHQIDFYLESNGGLFGSSGCLEHVMKVSNITHKDDHPFTQSLITGESLYRDDINKICFLQPTIPFHDIHTKFKDTFEVLQCTIPMFGKDSGELAVKGVNKQTAIEAVLTALQQKQEQTIAIGDGLNDREMITYCQVGIAMGNAHEGLKSVADYVCEDIEEDGFYKAFKTYQLI